MNYAKGMFLSFLIWFTAVLISYFNLLFLSINGIKYLNIHTEDRAIHRNIGRVMRRYKLDDLYKIHCIVEDSNISKAVFTSVKKDPVFWERYFFFRGNVAFEIFFKDGYIRYISQIEQVEKRDSGYYDKKVNIYLVKNMIRERFNEFDFEFIVDFDSGLVLYSGEEIAFFSLKEVL